jgi:hypothetical protein
VATILAENLQDLAKGKTSVFSAYQDIRFREFGFMVIHGCINGKKVASVSQDIYSAECSENIEQAESYIMEKVLKKLK